ncbi:MAG: SPFH domain / Band 7 family protein [Candidatus Wolfebacteria bacterium GW2011_GWA2_47_9b]|uniref:SPFH domain / Band 7 family protein n=1 Tax=Candidatus Wolfebacteria bacterium GW2011_GWA2_47_9b TaxID=1619005 RepID=A0A0G1U693_9BACT|nr:MAG: SPFH domain / Band 7 family protein [Candidatus Wolfebacteria bacterium GW2011_GWA2_47_9b]
MTIITPIAIAIILVIITSIRQINQYEKGVKFTFGKFTAVMEPGWRIVWPVIQTYQKVDVRIKAVDVPDQNAITRDNVSVKVNAVIYYKVSDAPKSVIEVEGRPDPRDRRQGDGCVGIEGK